MPGREANPETGASGPGAAQALTRPQPWQPTPRRRMPLSIAEASEGMLCQDVIVRPSDVVFVKGILEASDGIAVLFAERGGELTLAAPAGRDEEFAELIQDLERDVGVQRRGALR